VAVYPDHGSDTTTLLRHADRTMGEAKGYRGAHAVHDPASAPPASPASRSFTPVVGAVGPDGPDRSGKDAADAPPPTVLQFYRTRPRRTPPSSR